MERNISISGISIRRLFYIALALAVPYLVLQIGFDIYTHGSQPPAILSSILTVVAIFGAIGLLWLVQRRVAAATEAVAEQADRIAAGDYQGRMDVSAADSEFSRLVAAMNHMAEVIDEASAELRAHAARDNLTGLANGAHLDFALDQELKRVRRHGGTLCVAMLDIDRFNEINSGHGHDAGDEVLREFARVLRLHTRSSDLAARYNGQTFALILYDANVASISGRLESIRVAIDRMTVVFGGKELPHVQISIGVAEALRHGETVGELLNGADDAMRQAKDAGGNRTKVFTGILD